MVRGKSGTIKGDPSLGRSMISLKAMLRMIRKEGQGYLVEGEHKGIVVPEFLQPTVEKYEPVFHIPEGLPPSRGHEHGITLKEGTDPVSVRPYRYSQAQKDEIEALIQDMLKAGIIQPSNSPCITIILGNSKPI